MVEIKQIEARSKEIYDSLDQSPSCLLALGLLPIRSMRLMLEKTSYYRKNKAYAKQGRFGSTNRYRALAQRAEDDSADLHYYNNILKDGKWSGIMDPYANYLRSVCLTLHKSTTHLFMKPPISKSKAMVLIPYANLR